MCGYAYDLNRRVRSIINAHGESVQSATAGQLIKLTGVSRNALRLVDKMTGGSKGGGPSGSGEAAMPVGHHVFTFKTRKDMDTVVEQSILELNY